MTDLKVDSHQSSKLLKHLVFCISVTFMTPNVLAGSHTHSSGNQSISSKIESFIKVRYKRPSSQAHEIAQAIISHSNKNHLDPAIVTGLIAKESSFKPAITSKGNSGLMQINVRSHKDKIHSSLRNPGTNISLGVDILKECLSVANGDIGNALSLYNRGCSASNKNAKIRQGRSYTRRVLKEAQVFRSWDGKG